MKKFLLLIIYLFSFFIHRINEVNSIFIKIKIKRDLSFNLIRNFAFLICFFISMQAFSQNRHNIPPNFKISPKTNTEKNYSFKLHNQPDYGTVASTDAQFLKDLTPVNMEDMKINAPESYKYYSEALVYYKQLSQRAKALFTGDEIWFIYMFDQNLKDKLKNI